LKPGLLLDTHALIWAFNNGDLSSDALAAIDQLWTDGGQLMVSKISAWEIGMLVRRGRLSLPASPLRWFNGVLSMPGAMLTDLTPEILIEASGLPDCPMRDPADQILVATARALDLPIMTRDRVILSYASEGHVRAIAC
jgi:PIN domain nuclease of toxin-antitoxin system